MTFTPKQIAELEAVAKVLADPIVRDSDKQVLAEMLRRHHQQDR